MVKMLLSAMGASVATAADTMLAVQGHGASCYVPDWSCLDVNEVPVPAPGLNQALVQMKATSVNPVDIDQVEPGCDASILSCKKGTLGTDGAGVVVKSGSLCNLKPGDEVYGNIGSSYAEYTTVSCGSVATKPSGLSFVDAGAIGVVAGTSYQCLEKLGLPADSSKNLTVVVTSGQGGTGSMAVQLAKAMGATRVITAASGDGMAYAKKLGADEVVDYHEQDLFDDYLQDDSVDLVFDNFGVKGTADRAMHAIRKGGAFLVLLGGNGGTISKHPKDGVKQVNFGFQSAGTKEFAQIAKYYDEGKLQPVTAAVYGIKDVPRCWTDKEHGKFLGKLVIDITNMTTSTVLV
jgi:NADPH:quinone reductase-like Zn-dependent oxidoreductase